MITIKCGKLFCEKYNEVNNTSLTPKEIFCDVVAPLLFNSNRHLVNWTNSKFFYMLQYYKKGKFELNDENFAEVVKSFCELVETDYGIMTAANVYYGCAIPKLERTGGQTTMFSYSDNVYFDIDERYCSFIGSIFSIQCNGLYFIIDNKELVWEIYEGILMYRYFIDNNTNIDDKQLYAWNSIYLKTKYDNKDVLTKIEEYIVKDRLDINNKINFSNFLFLISKLNKNIKHIQLYSCKNGNFTYPAILLNLDYVKRMSEIFQKLYVEMDEDFEYFNFDKTFGQKNILYKAIQNGAVYEGMFNPIEDIDPKNKYQIKYIEFIMNEFERNLAKNFVLKIKKAKKLSEKKNINEEDIFKERKIDDLVLKLSEFPNNEDFIEFVEYLYDENTTSDKIRNILTYSKFIFKANK